MSITIDYVPPPTGERFMKSNAKMRVLMGPVGCLPAESEFLTPSGWVRMDEWEPGMSVGVWCPESRAVSFEQSEYVRLPAEDNFIRFDSGSLVMDLSPEHRVAYYDYKGDFKVQVAAQIARKPSNRLIPTTFVLDRPDAPLSDHEIRLRVMFAADGTIPPMGRKVAVCVRRERKVERLRWLLADVEHTYTVYDRGADEHTFRFEWPYGRAEKSLNFVWGLSTRQLGVVLEELDHWDGLHDHAEKRFHTTVREDADAMQFAAHACGLRATIAVEDYPQAAWKSLYRVYIRREGSHRNVVRIRGDYTNISDVPATDGYKYCFTTSTGFFVARHKGGVFITGNSGKSVTCCFEVVRRASMQEPNQQGIRKTRVAVVRETARQLEDTTIKTFLDWFPPGVCGSYMRTKKTYFFKVGDVECEVMFRALDDADDVANLNSLELTFAWFNECRDIHPDIVDAMSKRIGRYPSPKDVKPTWFGMWGDTNPPTMDTWWYYQMEGLNPKDGVSPNDNGWAVFKQPSGRSAFAENIENLPEGYYDTQGRSEDYIRVYIDGEYGLSSAGQPVYQYFRPDYHMSREALRPLPGGLRPIIVGMDLGLTPAAVIGQHDARGRALILDELVSFDMGVQRFVRTELKPRLFERFAGSPVLVVVDPAGVQRAQTDERSAVDIIKAEGLRVIPAKTNKVSARLNAVDDYLMRQVDGDSAFLVDPRCTALKAAMMGGYRFDKNGKIDKTGAAGKHSHIAEALQYLMLHIGRSNDGGDLIQRREVKPVAALGWT